MELSNYKYRGARSLILLHEHHINSFLNTWKQAKLSNVKLPVTEDKDYESLETLLMHVLRSAGNYMRWICENLNIPEPNILPVPDKENIEKKADEYILHLFEQWRIPLADLKEEKFHSPVYKSNWGVEYCIDAMLEHAVMHPIRHEFQLKELILGLH